MKLIFKLVLLLLTASQCFAQDCPLNWELHDNNCYHFVHYPPRTFLQASAACQMNGAALVSVNDNAENTFIVGMLTTLSQPKEQWYTSGLNLGGKYKWIGDGSDVMSGDFWSYDPAVKFPHGDDTDSQVIVYSNSDYKKQWAWLWSRKLTKKPYICEISKVEAFKINRPIRDYLYGQNASSLYNIPRGPEFTIEPQSVIITDNKTDIQMQCAGYAIPEPTYRWLKRSVSTAETAVTSSTNRRYTLTNGKLTIANPDIQEDSGTYHCEITNAIGSIISDPVTVSKGFLQSFSNVHPGSVRAERYMGTYIDCTPPVFNPMVTYSWMKGSGIHFVRPTLNKQTFASRNGRFYISEVSPEDGGSYKCIVTLAAPYGQVLATRNPPSRISLDHELIVQRGNANNYGPTIHDDFPQIFPNPPKRGETLHLECLAYGKLPLTYSWEWNGGSLPPGSRQENLNRVVVLPNAQMVHSGNYTCKVRRGEKASDTKSLHISIVSKPYLLFPIGNKFVDKGSHLTWRCMAVGDPAPTYTWLKDGQVLQNVPGQIEIIRNTLIIQSTEATAHNGMYQCVAQNTHGQTQGSGQLKVLAFPPSFRKHPVRSNLLGTIGGNITIACKPEAAPTPTILWYKDNRQLSLSSTSSMDSSHFLLLPSGSLVISILTQSDSGRYKCEATNDLGTASSEGVLNVVTHLVMTAEPENTKVVVNNTAFLFCEASHNALTTDLIYNWKFNEKVIDIEEDPDFVKGIRDGQRGLYIRNAQFKHTGTYYCSAETVQDTVTRDAFLTVLGPPGEPAGVFSKNKQGRDLDLRWSPGTDHGDIVQAYMIEAQNNFNHTWVVLVRELHEQSAVITNKDEDQTKRGIRITDLGPGTNYKFRVTARNRFGWGEPSVPSPWYKIEFAAPAVAPSGIGGGGGSELLLNITWELLRPQDEGGPGIKYNAYFREKSSDNSARWTKETVISPVHSVYKLVDVDKFYTPYEVKVQALNNYGSGPNSSISIVYSAESMPVATPSNIQGTELNSTAATIYWNPVVDNRLNMKGRVQGYQINYWLAKYKEDFKSAKFVRHYGQRSKGMIIGLTPNTNYRFNVQVFNTAGLGAVSQSNWLSTYYQAPKLYPEYVNVYSYSATSVQVTWRGVNTLQQEETVRGYQLWYWPSSEDIRNAKSVTAGKAFSAIVSGLDRNVLYKLRVMATSLGGDGKKTPAIFFTLGGQVPIDQTTTDIMALGSRSSASIILFIMCIIVHHFTKLS